MQWIVIILAVVLVVLTICFLRAYRAGKGKGRWELPAEEQGKIAIDEERALESLQLALQIPTVSYADPEQVDWAQFEKFAAFLQERYPLFHAAAEREIVADHALIYRWKGSETDWKPVIWMAHQDVVPATDEQNWKYPPFSGQMAEGCIWGRGALDMKSHLIAMFESCEALLGQGYQPKRDLYFALGYDEEIGVDTSAKDMLEALQKKNVDPLYIFDEGTNGFFDGSLFGVDAKILGVAVAEKGFGNLRVEVKGAGGHASLPPRYSALAQLTSLAQKMDTWQAKAHIAPPMSEMIEALLPQMCFTDRLMYANLWLFSPIAKHRLSKHPQTNAWMRSTAALTVASAAPQANILPTSAAMVYNIRSAPWDQAENVSKNMLAKAGLTPAGNPEENIFVMENLQDASAVASRTSVGGRTVFDTVRRCFPEAQVLPSLMLGGTDSYKMRALCKDIYRLSPFRSYEQYGHCIHNRDERIEMTDFIDGIAFFAALCRAGDAAEESSKVAK